MKQLILISLTILVAACESKQKQLYNFDKELYIEVLSDLYYAEQLVRNHNTNKDSVRNALRAQIFRIHEIEDTTAFLSELNLLMEDTEYYIKIHDSIISRFENKDDKLHEKHRK